jgi:hypothetical protein
MKKQTFKQTFINHLIKPILPNLQIENKINRKVKIKSINY